MRFLSPGLILINIGLVIIGRLWLSPWCLLLISDLLIGEDAGLRDALQQGAREGCGWWVAMAAGGVAAKDLDICIAAAE